MISPPFSQNKVIVAQSLLDGTIEMLFQERNVFLVDSTTKATIPSFNSDSNQRRSQASRSFSIVSMLRSICIGSMNFSGAALVNVCYGSFSIYSSTKDPSDRKMKSSESGCKAAQPPSSIEPITRRSFSGS